MNKGFEIKLNDELLCKAGIKINHGVVSCILTAVSRKKDKGQELLLDIAGLNTDTSERNKWIIGKNLNHNDIITIKIIQDNFDSPKIITNRIQKELTIEQKFEQYNKLKEELKEYL